MSIARQFYCQAFAWVLYYLVTVCSKENTLFKSNEIFEMIHFQNPDDQSSENVDDHIARLLINDLPVRPAQPVPPAGVPNPIGIEQNQVRRLIQNIPIQPDGNISDPAPEPGSLRFENRKLSVALIYKENEWPRFGSVPGNLKLIHEKLMKLTQKMREENSEHYQVK